MDRNKTVIRVAQVVAIIFTLITFLELPTIMVILPISIFIIGGNAKLKYWDNNSQYVIKAVNRCIVAVIIWILLLLTANYFNIKILITPLLDYIIRYL